MRRLTVVGAVALLALGVPYVARAASPPAPDPNFATTLVPSACSATNGYEAAQYAAEGWKADSSGNYVRYGANCQRLHFTFGPIAVKPGQNDVLIEPVTIEKPAYDGEIVRFKPDLVRADGSVPPIEEIHLHHGTWISFTQNYGSGPFFASGEEKTIGNLPTGYGFPIKGTDTWQLLYMIHNLTAKPDTVWITYDIDYLAQAAADSLHLKAAYPVWLDVRPSNYPVFNVQRSFGAPSADGSKTCTWPRDECAAFDPWGNPFVGQGRPGNLLGTDWRFPNVGGSLGQMGAFNGGTVIGIGGHVHPGGRSVDLQVVRGAGADGKGGVSRTVFSSTATYWQWAAPTAAGGPPTSWDLSMAVTGLPRWAVHVKPGDIMRLNATYDASIQSTYENMGIMVAFVAPDLPNGTPADARAIDPFAPGLAVDTTPNCASGGVSASPRTLCTQGVVTHGHMAEADHHGGAPTGPITAGNMSSHTDHVAIAGFSYAPGDLGTVATTGIPTVALGQTVSFVNADAAADVYHTVTSCAYPCSASTGIAFPLGDGASDKGARVDFDSNELGFGPNFGPAKNSATWDLTISPTAFHAGQLYTYFCRIHPSMRGVFAVE